MQNPSCEKLAPRISSQPKHFEELDSLRGLAALVVVLTHYFSYSLPDPINYSGKWLLHATPLGILLEAHASVIFFFLLSGFVLSLSFLKPGAKPAYKSYLIKRVFRLYPAFIASISAAAFLKFCFNTTPIPGFADWYNHFWCLSSSWQIFLSHLPLITLTNAKHLNSPIWSLIVEMRLSLIFPLFVIASVKFHKKALGTAVVLSIIAGWVETQFLKNHYESLASIMQTLSYSSCFMLGIYLAQNREEWIRKASNLHRSGKFAMLVAGCLLYTADLWIAGNSPGENSFLGRALTKPFILDPIICLGAAVFIILGISSQKASFLLHQPIVHFLGKISYSLYLWHMVVLSTLVAFLHPYLGATFTCVLALGASIGVSTLSYYAIELPGMNTGRRLAQKFSPKLQPQKPVAVADL